MKQMKQIKPVIGLEVHIQLNAPVKIFSPENYSFSAQPNTCIHPISLALPGTLPRLNEQVLRLALRLALALRCRINSVFWFSRKNYFYPDLPKGYQITQFDMPYAVDGVLRYLFNGEWKSLKILRIQIEEDTGKSIHELDPFHTLLDFNRAGVALLELVTAPHIGSPEEAEACLRAIRQLVRHLKISEASMEEGSLRCDANVSLEVDDSGITTERVEIKNLNSFRFLRQALHAEIERQKQLILEGKSVKRETRGYDPASRKTFSMRTKEHLHDYRYFPEPDLPPIYIPESLIEDVRSEIGDLPEEIWKELAKLGVSEKERQFLLDEPDIYAYFKELCDKHKINKEEALKWILGPVTRYLNEKKIRISEFPLSPSRLAELIKYGENSGVHMSLLKQVFRLWVDAPGRSLHEILREAGVSEKQMSQTEIKATVERLIKQYPEKVHQYRSGKKGIFGFFMGEAMRELRGRADPRIVSKIVRELLEG